jgi:hypothetical protein
VTRGYLILEIIYIQDKVKINITRINFPVPDPICHNTENVFGQQIKVHIVGGFDFIFVAKKIELNFYYNYYY